MKVYILSALFFLLLLNGNSQGRKTLDTEFGLNKFKLETPFSLYKKDIKYEWIDRNGIELYSYIGSDIWCFGLKVNAIDLCFFQDKLYSISFSFGVLDKEETYNLRRKLNDKYDLGRIVNVNAENQEADITFAVIWETGKSYLQLEENICSSKYKPCETDLFLSSKRLKSLIKQNSN